ncbi:MAG TPA: 2-oxo acid dehydrogenase subunit E2 [Vicinamibacterales bacterium]|jgi:pyruvate dehydrogenase E2 component (dihydrolipoamide acetyltransferase)|nr:2-oxo acid dehydrogenase subunit E2 [Vicinamibacterales bacterium]
MASELKLPELGENVHGGDVLRLLVKAGDRIANEQPVIELETDKATIEVPSSLAGIVKDLKVKPGDKVKVGQTILTVDEASNGAQESKGATESTEQRTAKPAPQPVGAPEEGGLSQEARPPRQAPRLPEDEVERDTTEVTPRQKRGEVVDISRAPRGPAQGAPPPDAAADAAAPAAAPSVRRIARELGVEIRQVTGTGPGGRITVEDVQSFVKQALAGPSTTPGTGPSTAPAAPGAQPLPDFSKWGEIERKPLSNIRRKTAEHLGHAWNVIPHVTQHDRADITALEELRKKYGPQAERAGGKLTVTAVALKIVAGALRKFPQFGSSIDSARGQLVFKKYAHIGVAVDTDRGLLVPVIRDVETKGIVELSAELAKASEKARAGKLSLDDMSGGVITITNLGGIGGVGFTPIVNWPEVAILGISRGSYEPVWNGSSFEPRLMLPLSLSYDHRVIDGADAARFLRWVADAFEQAFVLAL